MALRRLSVKHLNHTAFTWVLVIFTIGVWLILSFCTGAYPHIEKMVRLISAVVATDLIAWWIFARWLWRWRIFRNWLVLFPDLNGTWKGHLTSSYPTASETSKTIPVTLTIKQTLLSIKCTQRSSESASYSYGETFQIDNDSGIRRLVYCYSNSPKARVFHRSQPHDGTASLEINESQMRTLEGRYWTSRATIGDIKLKFYKADRSLQK